MTRISSPSLQATIGRALQLQALLSEAESAQWQRSRVIAVEDDPGIRAKGGHGDPTFDATSDPARLALRAAVIGAEDILARQFTELTEQATRLQKALDKWNGGL